MADGSDDVEVNSKRFDNGKSLIPPKVLKKREIKWERMLNEWNDLYIRFHYKKLKQRCYKGIPPSVRPQAWFYLCCDQHLIQAYPQVFEYLSKLHGNPKCIKDIKQDLNRRHIKFVKNVSNQKDLFKVLKAYCILNEEVGYCTAQASIAAFLLMHMPLYQAFWCFVFLCNKYLYGYYDHESKAVSSDGKTLITLLERVSPKAYKHLKNQEIEPALYLLEWFPYAFTRTLPLNTLLRVWDMFLYEGVQVLFKVALVLIKGCLGSSASRKSCPTSEETINLLKNPPQHVMEEEYLIHQMTKLSLKDEDFVCERTIMSHSTTELEGSPESNALQLLKIMLLP